MCRAIAFNESQELLRVEMLHDDRSAARMNCQRNCCQRRRVINRRRLKVDRAFAETPCFLKKIEDREVSAGGWSGNGRKMPFGRPVVPEE